MKSYLGCGAAILSFTFTFTAAVPAPAQAPEPDRTAIYLEALSRLKDVDLEANPAVKAAVLKVLDNTRGTPPFVQIVQQFKLKDQNPGLLEIAVAQPASEAGVQAIRLILQQQDFALLEQTLTGADLKAAVNTATALGNASDRRALRVLLPLVTQTARDLALRKQAVRSLAGFQEGAAALLKLAAQDRLAPELKFTASAELNQTRWPEIQAQAATLLPLPQGRNAQPLPPLAELLTQKGDVRRGAEVFFREEVACAKCHLVNGEGIDFGPALSEIGGKLGKDALYEAILDPSAGISFDYEGHEIELKSGDELFGIIVSETAEELTIKDARAIPTRIQKRDIVRRVKIKTSLMPAGLQATMSRQDLVDLVEYLSTLKSVVRGQ
jgi:putative heme-binding domain-containing protein